MWWFCVLLFATASGRPEETQRSAYVSSDAAVSALSSSKDDWPGIQLNSHYNSNSINGQECMQPGGMSKVVQGDVYYDCVCVPNERGSLVLKCSPCDRCSRRNFPSHLPNVISVKPIIALPVIPEHSERVPPHFNPAPSPPVPVPSPPVPVSPPFNPVPSPPVPTPSPFKPLPSSPVPVPSPFNPVPVPPPSAPVEFPPVPMPSPFVPVPFSFGNQYISGSDGQLMVPASISSVFTPVPVPLPSKPLPYSPVPVPSPPVPVPSPPIPIPSLIGPIPSPFNPVPVPSQPVPVPLPPVPVPSPAGFVPSSPGNWYISGYRVFPVTSIPGSMGNNDFVNSRTSDESSESTSNAEPWGLLELLESVRNHPSSLVAHKANYQRIEV